VESFQWLWTACTPEVIKAGQSCVEPLQVAYLAALVIGAIILFVAARRSRDLSTTVLALMPVAIAINIAVGSIVSLLKLPIYLDSIGTVLVGVLAGPWAGALTGLLSNLIWALLPVPGGAGPINAFFAPVAAVIGLMAGFWGARGVFQLRADDPRVGSFLALAAGVAATALAFLVVQQAVGLPNINLDVGDPPDPALQSQLLANQSLFVTEALAFVALGAIVAWLSARTIFSFRRDGDPRIRSYLAIASGVAAFVLVGFLLRLLFGPSGWFGSLDGSPTSALPGTNLSGLAWSDPIGFFIQFGLGVLAGVGTWYWASRGENARLFPVWIGGLTTGLVAAAMSAPISAGVFGGVTGSGQDLLVSLYRTLGLSVFQSAFAQGLTSDPLDKTISYTVVFLILAALPVTVRTIFSRGETTVAET
jgi:Cobalt uptake substrate-specific transmembrane region